MDATVPSPPRPPWAHSFRHRDFRFLWSSLMLHTMAVGMEQVALGWLVLEMTDSPFMVGVANAARMAPFFFLGIPAGAVADRVDRRVFTRLTTLGAAATAGAVALLLAWGRAGPWEIVALGAASGCAWAFHQTSVLAYAYDIVGREHALNAMSLTAISRNLGAVVGAAAAGVIVTLAGPAGGYAAVAAAYVAALSILLPMRDPGQAAPVVREPMFQNVIGAIRLIRTNRVLLFLLGLTSATEILGFSHQSLMPVLARDTLGVGVLGLGFITAVRRAGGTLALALLAVLGPGARQGTALLASLVAFGLGLVVLSHVSGMVVFLVVVGLVNAAAQVGDTLLKTLMQQNVPNEERGRAMGFWVLGLGTGPAGHLEVGGMASALGAPLTLMVNGGLLAFLALTAAVGLPRIRRLR